MPLPRSFLPVAAIALLLSGCSGADPAGGGPGAPDTAADLPPRTQP